MRLRIATALALTTVLAYPCASLADDALTTLEGFRKTAPIDWPTVPQTGPKADQVKQLLTKIKMPPGFHIDLYALVPDARHMAVGPQGVATFIGTRKSKIYVATDRSRSGVAEEVKEFAPTLPKNLPRHGLQSERQDAVVQRQSG
jgi:hypothetical protein